MDGTSPRWTCGKASDYIHHLPALLADDQLPPVVLYCRKSPGDRHGEINLAEAVGEAESDLAALGITPLKILAGIESSRIQDERPLLEAAIEFGHQHGAVLVALSRDRFIRAREYGPGATLRAEPPSVYEYRLLVGKAAGVPLATLLHPDATNARSTQICRGQDSKGKRGGRPRADDCEAQQLAAKWNATVAGYAAGKNLPGHKLRWRALGHDKVRWLLLVLGKRKVSEISRLIGIPRNTILRWLAGEV